MIKEKSQIRVLEKILIVFIIIATITIGSFLTVGVAEAYTKVRGYTTKRGTYVQPHYRTNSNSTKIDNWSTKGNINPYTGKKGHKNY
jgi:hypothetical protein